MPASAPIESCSHGIVVCVCFFLSEQVTDNIKLSYLNMIKNYMLKNSIYISNLKILFFIIFSKDVSRTFYFL